MTMLQQQFEKSKNLKAPVWLHKLREDNFLQYQTLGLPTIHEETWKYTNVKPLTKKEFSLAESDPSFSTASIPKPLDTLSIFIVNGFFHSMFNTLENLTIKSLAMASIEKHSAIKRLNQLAKSIPHGFAKLNTAFIHDGVFLEISENAIIEKPIHIFYINTQAESIQYHRNLIILKPCSKATIIEHYYSPHDSEYCTNTISEIFVESAAELTHIKVQNEALHAYHIGTTKVQQHKDSVLNSIVLSLGGKLSRSDTQIDLIDKGCHAEQTGLYIGRDRQHFDHHTEVLHQKPFCTSKQLYKGILDESARAVFNGKVHVFPNAIKTDSSQMNKNLLLSDKAEIDSKPELEIYNDDVKCSHGAAVGQLDETQLFYLLSRGFDKNAAKSLLMYAFIHEIIASIKHNDLRDYLQKVIIEKLPSPLSVEELLR